MSSALRMAPKKKSGLFAYSNWDIVPVLAAFAHAAFLVTWFMLFRRAPWWALLVMGFIYSVSISWNINGISHNFLHNPYFRWAPLNRAFSLLESLVIGFSQEFYEAVHKRHHVGNSDKQDAAGQTIDWLSIYRHGHDGEAENVWKYTFLSFFRDDVKETYREVKRLSPSAARWGVFEAACTGVMILGGFVLNWRFMLLFMPFWYFGHCLSYLNGFYLHYGGNPDKPIAWGVSCYEKIYNWTWFNNGYHAEHHYRPRVHWMKMRALHLSIKEEQQQAKVRVIKPPHALGFLDPNLPKQSAATPSRSVAEA